jgi:hypothetical protein
MRKQPAVDKTSIPPVASVFEELLKALPDGVATLRYEHQSTDENYVYLIPTNPGAAKIAARGGGSLRYEVIIGENTLYEIMPDKKHLGRSAVEALQAICLAVFAGHFEETIYSFRKTVTRTVGRLTVDGEEFTTRAVHEFYPLIPKKKQIIKYAAYF